MPNVANDLTLYERFADDWWRPESSVFKSLQAISICRLEVIGRWFGDVRGRRIVDLGCGGGLLSVPLIERGAIVTGFDISQGSLKAASNQAKGKGEFVQADIREVPLPDNCADFVLIADVLDHIPDYDKVLAEAARILKPGGLMYANVLNRTWLSYLGAILIGEGFGLVPKNTHDYNLLVRPEELRIKAEAVGFQQLHCVGELPRLFKTVANWRIFFRQSRVKAIAYSACFKAT